MEFEHRNHVDAIDQTLAALKSAAPPEGMEARILQRLQQHAPATPFAGEICSRALRSPRPGGAAHSAGP